MGSLADRYSRRRAVRLRRVRWSVVVVFLLVLGVFVGSGLFERMMLYPVPALAVPSPPPEPFEEVPLVLVDGTPISAWWSAPSAPRWAILFLHGNGENLESMRHGGVFEGLHRVGAAVLAIDYPGYGRSGGRPSEDVLVEAAVLAFDHLEARRPDLPLLIAGWSLGAAVAVQTAARRPAEGLVVMSAWDTLPRVAANHFPGWLVRLVLSDLYNSLAAAAEVSCPVLQLHGTQDSLIPVGHGRALREAFAGEVRWVEVAAGHNDLLGRPLVWQELERFLDWVPSRQAASR